MREGDENCQMTFVTYLRILAAECIFKPQRCDHNKKKVNRDGSFLLLSKLNNNQANLVTLQNTAAEFSSISAYKAGCSPSPEKPFVGKKKRTKINIRNSL